MAGNSDVVAKNTLKSAKLAVGKTHTFWKSMKGVAVKGLFKEDKKMVETYYKTLNSGLSKQLKNVEGSKDPSHFIKSASEACKTISKYKGKISQSDLPGTALSCLLKSLNMLEKDLKAAVVYVGKKMI